MKTTHAWLGFTPTVEMAERLSKIMSNENFKEYEEAVGNNNYTLHLFLFCIEGVYKFPPRLRALINKKSKIYS